MTGLLRVTDAPHDGRLTLASVHPGARLVALRATILGGSAAGVGTASHVAGDGLLPGPLALTVLCVAAVAIASALVLTRATRLRILLTLVGGQALMHVVLASLGGHRGVTPGESGGFWAHQLQHLTASGPSMVLAHTAGAVMLALFLAFAEERLWRRLVGSMLTRHLRRLAAARLLGAAAAAVPAPARVAGPARRAPVSTPAESRPALGRRGPPVLLLDLA